MTVDEIRGLEELNPMGGDADKLGKPNYGAPAKTTNSGDDNDNPTP
jgi:hypothetical protein